MALRLGDYVIGGYFNNTKKHATHGVVQLRGWDGPLTFQLTGDAGETLRGRSFEFHMPEEHISNENAPSDKVVARMQIGPVGTMELRMFKIPLNDIREVLEKKIPLEYEWRPCLYLEWFSQNGRVVLELTDPTIVMEEGEPLPELEIPEGEPGGTLGFTVMKMDEEGNAETQSFIVDDSDEEDDDPDDIDSYLEKLNRDKEIAYRCENEEAILSAQMFDKLIPGEQDEFVGSLLQPQKLPAPFEVDEKRAEELVKSLLIELAMRSVAIHLCEHCTWQEAYRYIIEEIINEERVPRGVSKTGWTWNYNYGETCPKCEAEFEKEWERENPKD